MALQKIKLKILENSIISYQLLDHRAQEKVLCLIAFLILNLKS